MSTGLISARPEFQIIGELLETPGVVKAEVRYPAGSATVQFDSSKTDTSKLIAVVNDTGYKAAVSNSAQE